MIQNNIYPEFNYVVGAQRAGLVREIIERVFSPLRRSATSVRHLAPSGRKIVDGLQDTFSNTRIGRDGLDIISWSAARSVNQLDSEIAKNTYRSALRRSLAETAQGTTQRRLDIIVDGVLEGVDPRRRSQFREIANTSVEEAVSQAGDSLLDNTVNNLRSMGVRNPTPDQMSSILEQAINQTVRTLLTPESIIRKYGRDVATNRGVIDRIVGFFRRGQPARAVSETQAVTTEVGRAVVRAQKKWGFPTKTLVSIGAFVLLVEAYNFLSEQMRAYLFQLMCDPVAWRSYLGSLVIEMCSDESGSRYDAFRTMLYMRYRDAISQTRDDEGKEIRIPTWSELQSDDTDSTVRIGDCSKWARWMVDFHCGQSVQAKIGPTGTTLLLLGVGAIGIAMVIMLIRNR